MIRKKSVADLIRLDNGFRPAQNYTNRLSVALDASAGEGKSDKIVLEQ